MISIGENKAIICKGNFHPAELYKGDKKIAGYNVTEFSGESGVTLENCYNDKTYNTQIVGNSIQNGTPTPEAPIEVQSVGELQTEGEYAGKYKIPVKVRGKNLWDRGDFIKSDAAKTSCLEVFKASDYPWIKGGTTLAITLTVFVSEADTRKDPRFSFQVMFTDNTGSYPTPSHLWQKGTEKKYSCTITLPTGISGVDKEISQLNIRPIDFNSNPDAVWEAYVKDIQIELGDTATEYEPYIEPQTYDIYLDEPLHKIREYADYIDFEKGVVIRNIAEKEFDGMEKWERFSQGYLGWRIAKVMVSSAEIYCLCNYLKGETWDRISGNYSRTDGNYVVGVAKKSDYINVTPSPSLPTLEEWKAQLAVWNDGGTPFTVWYVIPTIEEPISVPELPTFKETTVYEIGTQITATVNGKYKEQEG